MYIDSIINHYFYIEEGTVIGDYSDDVDNKTLMFLPGTGNCASILAINGSKLVLKENLLNQALCVRFIFQISFFYIEQLSCDYFLIFFHLVIYRGDKVLQTYKGWYFTNMKNVLFHIVFCVKDQTICYPFSSLYLEHLNTFMVNAGVWLNYCTSQMIAYENSLIAIA